MMVAPARLADQVARVAEIDPQVLDRVTREALTAPSGWVVEYDEFQSGGWLTLSLYNDTGRATDVTIRDCTARPTDLLARMPATRALLESFDLRFMWARIARLRSNSFLWEHRDYGELADAERQRLHVPLQTNASAALAVGGSWVHLATGGVWRLVPTYRHGACNLTGPDRIHLILDCYGDPAYDRFTANPTLRPGDARELPEAGPGQLDGYVVRAAGLIRLGYPRAAERSLLRLFYRHTLPAGVVYDLITTAYERVGEPARAHDWQDKKKTMLGG
jgi:hypothetical protein